MSELRIALTLPGGMSLGTFEAGAVSALLTGIGQVNAVAPGAVRVDCISGASAGALSALLAARVLMAGEHAVPMFHRAWVSGPSLGRLQGRRPRAPLSLRHARAIAREYRSAPAPADGSRRQASPVTLTIPLGCLRGYPETITLDTGATVTGMRYLDVAKHTLEPIAAGSRPGTPQAGEWSKATDEAIASASHPLMFPPAWLDDHNLAGVRCINGGDVETKDGDGQTNGDDQQAGTRRRRGLWYTDGGLLDNAPLGACVDAVQGLDGGAGCDRLMLLVRANTTPAVPATVQAWTSRAQPLWTETLARALSLLITHSIDRDLLLVEGVNQRLRNAAKLAEALSDLLDDTQEVRDAMMAVANQPETPGMKLSDCVNAAVLQTANAVGKQQLGVCVVTPNPATPDAAAGTQLGAIIHRGRRERDFAIGYQQMLRWMESEGGLGARLPRQLSGAACEAARKVAPKAPRAPRGGRAHLTVKARLGLARLSLHVARIAAHDALAWERRLRHDGAVTNADSGPAEPSAGAPPAGSTAAAGAHRGG